MEGLCLKTGIIGITKPIAAAAGEIRTNPSHISAPAASRTSTSAISSASSSPRRTGPWTFPPNHPLSSLFSGRRNRRDAVGVEDTVSVDGDEEKERDGNWVSKILHVSSLQKDEEEKGKDGRIEKEDEEVDGHLGDEFGDENGVSMDVECDACRVYDDEIEFDKNSFSKLLRRVSLSEARLYAQMCYLASLAYSIPQIKPENLLKHHRLRFVTSSLDKKAPPAAAKSDAEKPPDGSHNGPRPKPPNPDKETVVDDFEQDQTKPTDRNPTNAASSAYQTAASAAASYLHSRTKGIVPFKFLRNEANETSSTGDGGKEVASLAAATGSVTAVVAAEEEVKQAVADDLNSTHSSPCGWFICDDNETSTRFFVIQGSESLASWQANLLFEPIQFEGLDVLVHRGIYEAAKGIYEHMLPEVLDHLRRHGDRSKIRFVGHSLGGSLCLLVNLMLLVRGRVPRSSLPPVVTFGSPSVMCGGDGLLRKLGLPKSHLRAVTMHRDIVPRAFSCNYPTRVAELLKAVNGNFRNHPCLNNQNLLYAPMGELLILQPDAKLSPSHDLLPAGGGLYVLTSPAENVLAAAWSVFLNRPHPLEILSDRSAYGSKGAIQRDHDVDSYLISVWHVIRQELKRVRRARREHRRRVRWPLAAVRGGVVAALKRWGRLVGDQNVHLWVVVLVPARLWIV